MAEKSSKATAKPAAAKSSSTNSKTTAKAPVKTAAKTTATKSTAKTSAKATVKTTVKATGKTAKTNAAKTSVEKASVSEKTATKTAVSKTKATAKPAAQTVKTPAAQNVVYDENSIQHLEGLEHIRLRPGMYIGSLGDGSNENDGIYILFKEGIDNSVDEFSQGYGKKIDIEIKDGRVKIRDYGRGIPLGALEDCVANVNTGAKYNNSVFKQAIGMNGVGIKATNALSSYFRAASIRDGKMAVVEYSKGNKVSSKTGNAKSLFSSLTGTGS